MSLPALSKMLGQSVADMHFLRSNIQSTLAAGEAVDPSTHAEFEAAIAQVIYQVRPHVVGGDNSELEKLWEKYGVERVIDFEARTSVEEEARTGAYGIKQESEERNIQRVDIKTLLDVTRLLDRITKELGLLPETAQAGRPGGKLS